MKLRFLVQIFKNENGAHVSYGTEGNDMTVDQAVKKYKLEPLNVYTAKAKAKELGIDISSATSKGEVRKMLADVIN